MSRGLQRVITSLDIATESDLPSVIALMNRAYRATGAEAGWTTEADYIDGDRTNDALLRDEMAANPKGTLLVGRKASEIQGCVWIEPLGVDAWYLGSLAIDPKRQGSGLGRELLAAAEARIRAYGGRTIKMTVVNIRHTLIAWYLRRGYRLTNETEPFPYDDARFGTPQRDDLCFVVLRKNLTSQP